MRRRGLLVLTFFLILITFVSACSAEIKENRIDVKEEQQNQNDSLVEGQEDDSNLVAEVTEDEADENVAVEEVEETNEPDIADNEDHESDLKEASQNTSDYDKEKKEVVKAPDKNSKNIKTQKTSSNAKTNAKDSKNNSSKVTKVVSVKKVLRNSAEENKSNKTIEKSTVTQSNKNQVYYSDPVYTYTVSGYTRDGKPFTKTYRSSNPNEVITYYDIEIKNEEGYFYEIKETITGKLISKKPVKVNYTYKEIVHEGDNIAYKTIEEFDDELPAETRVVVRKGVNGVTQLIERQKYLFDHYITTEYTKKVISERVDEIVRVGTLYPPWNSGKYFNSEKEAREWANKQIDDPNSKWYRHNWIAGPVNHTYTKWTVEFIK